MPTSKRPACRAKTKTGKPCPNRAKPGSSRCGIHATKATPKKRREWKPAFLKAFRQLGMVSAAADAVNIRRETAYEHRTKDPEFAQAWADIEAESTDQLEAEAHRRAVEGSDTLLIFLLKSRKPATYRENVKVEHSGGIEKRVTVDLSKLTASELEQLEAISQKIEA